MLHGFGLLNLINGEFTTFILLISSAFYSDLALRKVFDTKKTDLWYEKYFIRLSEWVRLISLFFIFTEIYKDKLNIFHLVLIFVLLGANIRYTLNAQIDIQNGKKLIMEQKCGINYFLRRKYQLKIRRNKKIYISIQTKINTYLLYNTYDIYTFIILIQRLQRYLQHYLHPQRY